MSETIRILVVEDEPMILMDLEDTLLGLGHSVVSSTTATGGEASLDRDGFDLAVIDFHLKDGTSVNLASKLADRAIPFILCTGTASSDEIRDVSHPAVLLEKPYTSAGLLDAVKIGLGSASVKARPEVDHGVGFSQTERP